MAVLGVVRDFVAANATGVAGDPGELNADERHQIPIYRRPVPRDVVAQLCDHLRVRQRPLGLGKYA
jgi:hypothetical protein